MIRRDETTAPLRRDIPLALLRTVLMITAYYVLLQAVAVSSGWSGQYGGCDVR